MRTRQMMPQSFQALREILAQPAGYEGLCAWEHVGNKHVACRSEIRFYLTIKPLSALCQRQFLLPSMAEGLPSIWRGPQYQTVRCPQFPSLGVRCSPGSSQPHPWVSVGCPAPVPPCSQPHAGDGVKPLAAVKLSCLGPCMHTLWVTCSVTGFCHLHQPLTLLI